MSSIIVVGIAVVGKSNEPLYLCDCEKEWSELQKNSVTTATTTTEEASTANVGNSSSSDNDDTDDPFGFVEFNTKKKFEQRNSMSLSCQILIHAAIDNLEEHIERPSSSGNSNKHGQMPVIVRKNSSAVISTTAASLKEPMHWLGLLLVDSSVSTMDENGSGSGGYSVYGYITATNIKLMVITKDVIAAKTPTETGIQHNSSNSNKNHNTAAVVTVTTTIHQAMHILLQEIHQHYISYLLNPFCDTRGGGLIRSNQFDMNIMTSIRHIREYIRLLLEL